MTENKKAHVIILSIYQDLGESFVAALTPEQMDGVTIGDVDVSFEVFAGLPTNDASLNERLAHADAVAIVLRFLDVLSLEKIKAIYRELLMKCNLPMGIVLLRDPGEIDFKVSCPACGQKLWLRDTDVGKRGRCPNCKKPFMIMSQVDHIKTQLLLADSVSVAKVVRDDFSSFEKAVIGLLKSVSGEIMPMEPGSNSEALKNLTTRIEIPES